MKIKKKEKELYSWKEKEDLENKRKKLRGIQITLQDAEKKTN